jgi:hypothetical protein
MQKGMRAGRRESKLRTRKLKWLPIIFFDSTARAAKRRIFLERFTLFQQGKSCAYTTLATRRHIAVELLAKSKHHFACSSPFTQCCHVRTLSKRFRLVTDLSAINSENSKQSECASEFFLAP